MKDLYQSQRAMRKIRRAALARGVIAALDIGTSKVTCFILQFEPNGKLRAIDGVGPMAGQADFRIIGAATTRSRGVRLGEIDTMRETESAIRQAVASAQKHAGVRVDHAIACLSGGRPASYGLAGEIELRSGQVTEATIGEVLAACDVPDFGRGRSVLHAQPVNFGVDHRTTLTDPRDQSGNRLSVDLHALTIDTQAVENLISCVRRCDLELAGLASASYVSALAAMTEDARELGAACIDLGGGVTGVSMFIRKHMIFADAVPMGSNLITQDISKGLGVSMALAERLKTFSGGVHATGQDDRDMLDLGEGDDPGVRRYISRADLIGIMRPRVEEILEEVAFVLDAAGFDALPSRQIVLTGGGSQIPGIDELARRMLGANVRIGSTLRVAGLPHNLSGQAFAAAVGLSLFVGNPQDEWWDFETPADGITGHGLRRALNWMRVNW